MAKSDPPKVTAAVIFEMAASMASEVPDAIEFDAAELDEIAELGRIVTQTVDIQPKLYSTS